MAKPCAGSDGAGVRAYIGVGSNLDDPLRQVERAFAALADLPASRRLAVSSLYRSRPLGDIAQPDFINAVVLLETRLPAPELLDELLAIEERQGRTRRPGERWGPRSLDLDLLLYGDREFSSPRLTVPHPEMVRRDFVLYPMFEIDPELVIPGAGSLRDCLQRCPRRGLQRMEKRDETAAS
ncbi:MAG: 2-amino-4-hydroxy-6-hydroxymethyldihydropteridine diphosphokinase [Gammaproteobacteria bacterium]|nr:2-amino-4-hydroxy-6-hydroxymethyldihydropteridine diphosphokinase [Gammaproteobacteria bacterium]